MRALGLTQYHSVLLVDSDVAVAGDLAPLFALPAEFAAVWDQSRWLNRCDAAAAQGALWRSMVCCRGSSGACRGQQRGVLWGAAGRAAGSSGVVGMLPWRWFAAAWAAVCPPANALQRLPSHLPSPPLPRRFRTVVERINGGVFLLRPCAAVEAHMLQLLERHPKLCFVHGTAEQDFFGW